MRSGQHLALTWIAIVLTVGIQAMWLYLGQAQKEIETKAAQKAAERKLKADQIRSKRNRVFAKRRITQLNFGRRILNALERIDRERFHVESEDAHEGYVVTVYRRNSVLIRVIVKVSATDDQISVFYEGRITNYELQEIEKVIGFASATMISLVPAHVHLNVDTAALVRQIRAQQ